MEPQPKPTPTWALSFPEPRSRPPSMSLDALHELITTKVAATDFIIVDVRRSDVDVCQFPADPWFFARTHCRAISSYTRPSFLAPSTCPRRRSIRYSRRWSPSSQRFPSWSSIVPRRSDGPHAALGGSEMLFRKVQIARPSSSKVE